MVPDTPAHGLKLQLITAKYQLPHGPVKAGRRSGAAPPTRSQLRLQRHTQAPFKNPHNGHQPTPDPLLANVCRASPFRKLQEGKKPGANMSLKGFQSPNWLRSTSTNSFSCINDHGLKVTRRNKNLEPTRGSRGFQKTKLTDHC